MMHKRHAAFFLLLFSSFWLLSCVQSKPHAVTVTPHSLSQDARNAYDAGVSLVLYGYQESIIASEAFADWEAYLGDFKATDGASFYISRIDESPLNVSVSSSSEFTIFMKKGYPVYFYDGLIVEPQVYTAVAKKYADKTLDDVDVAFLPPVVDTLVSY